MRVLKFGGSSLASPSTIRQVLQIVLEARHREPVTVVVSAFGGVTNQLLECARLAERDDPPFQTSFETLARRHRAAVASLVGRGSTRTRRRVDGLLHELNSTLEGIRLLRHCPLRSLDMRSVGSRTMLLVEGAGRLDEVTINGNRAEIKVLKDGLAGPTAVTLVGNMAYVSEARLNLRTSSEDPGPFRAVGVPYTAPQ